MDFISLEPHQSNRYPHLVERQSQNNIGENEKGLLNNANIYKYLHPAGHKQYKYLLLNDLLH